MDDGGSDSYGRKFDTVKDLWKEEIGVESETKKDWYEKGLGYWEGIEASVDGVLGGYGFVNEVDVKGSESFLNTLLHMRLGERNNMVALDCGCGIGRVTKNLLLRYFNEVDLLEPVSHFLETARENICPKNCLQAEPHRVYNFYCASLQEFTPEAGRYDVIWVQWCVGQLTDDDFISFFRRAKAGLKPYGFLILKENIASSGFVYDNVDRSITRSDLYFRQLFSQCGLRILMTRAQKGLPKELFTVRMYALATDAAEPRTHRWKRRLSRPAVIK